MTEKGQWEVVTFNIRHRGHGKSRNEDMQGHLSGTTQSVRQMREPVGWGGCGGEMGHQEVVGRPPKTGSHCGVCTPDGIHVSQAHSVHPGGCLHILASWSLQSLSEAQGHRRCCSPHTTVPHMVQPCTTPIPHSSPMMGMLGCSASSIGSLENCI